jgi:uncharacterized protein
VGQLLDEHWVALRFGSEYQYYAMIKLTMQATGVLPAHSIYTTFPELASWFVVLTGFTWGGAAAATARDLVLSGCLTSLAIGSTIACCLFAGNGESESLRSGIKAAAYFWMLSALLAWWRVIVYLLEEAYGRKVMSYFPVFRTAREKNAAHIIPGLGKSSESIAKAVLTRKR